MSTTNYARLGEEGDEEEGEGEERGGGGSTDCFRMQGIDRCGRQMIYAGCLHVVAHTQFMGVFH